MSKDHIQTYLDCSSLHLPEEFRDRLYEGGASLTVVGVDDFRRWIYVSEDTLSPEADEALPEPVRKVIRFALDQGCHIISFDPDGVVLDGDFELFEEDTSGSDEGS